MTRRAECPRPRRGAPLPAADIRAAAAVEPRPTLTALAARFGCSEGQVSRILRGIAWPGVGGPVAGPRPRGRARLGPPIRLRLPAELAGAVDQARGDRSPEEWLAQAAQERVARGVQARGNKRTSGGVEAGMDQTQTDAEPDPEASDAPEGDVSSLEVAILVSEEELHDLLTLAIECGGSNLWASIDVGEYQAGWANYLTARFTARREPDVEGGSMIGQSYQLSREKLVAGLAAMAREHRRHFCNILLDAADATTGDVLVQCALFGDVVYGERGE